ncbi:MAG: PEP-CTERM sorting domain-containing protein [Verrucomicrobiales bacterium]|jgi:hypothetical protein|nr:PEP-CTERM sorting domain-containing protein [Verrucomicrobiales bacterium]
MNLFDTNSSHEDAKTQRLFWLKLRALASSWPEFFQVLILTALLTPAASALDPGPFSGGRGGAAEIAAGIIDAGIAGFDGANGEGVVTGNSPNPIFVGWATGVEAYSPINVGSSWLNSSLALGPATADVGHIACLGDMKLDQIAVYLENPLTSTYQPGSITLSFDYAITNGSGADFAVFENGFASLYDIPATGGVAGGMFSELAYVEVSTDGIIFARFPSIYLNTAENLNITFAPSPKYDNWGDIIPGTDNLPPEPTNYNYGSQDPAYIYNIAGKHGNSVGAGYDNASWGTPFDLDTLIDFETVLACLAEFEFDLTNEQLASLWAQIEYNQSLVANGDLDLSTINFVRIVDIPGNGSFTDSLGNPIYDAWLTYDSGGFDLDAIGVLHQIPEPSTWALLIAGGGLLLILAKSPSSRQERNSPLEKGNTLPPLGAPASLPAVLRPSAGWKPALPVLAATTYTNFPSPLLQRVLQKTNNQ